MTFNSQLDKVIEKMRSQREICQVPLLPSYVPVSVHEYSCTAIGGILSCGKIADWFIRMQILCNVLQANKQIGVRGTCSYYFLDYCIRVVKLPILPCIAARSREKIFSRVI
jgi:hypothetical protein